MAQRGDWKKKTLNGPFNAVVMACSDVLPCVGDTGG